MEPTAGKKMNMSSRISPRTLAFLGIAALLLVLGAVMSVRSQASVAATAVNAPLSASVSAEHDYAARLAAVDRARYVASDTANLERSNAAAAARYAAMAEDYAHGDLMLAKPAIGNGSVTSEIAPTGKYSAGRTAPSEKHLPGGGP
jgi:hypothetical protein